MGAWAGVEPNEAWRRGLTATLDSFAPLGAKVLVLGDTPTPAQDVPSCVAGHLDHVSACAAARADAVRDDRLGVERDVAAAHDATFVPTSDWLCTATACPVIVGDLFSCTATTTTSRPRRRRGWLRCLDAAVDSVAGACIGRRRASADRPAHSVDHGRRGGHGRGTAADHHRADHQRACRPRPRPRLRRAR